MTNVWSTFGRKWVGLPGASSALTALGVSSYIQTLLDDTTAAQAQATLGVREVLTAARTYYVRTDGSNSNTGLVNNSGGAFLTLQKAWDVVAALDLSIYGVTIQVADGTYTAGITMGAMPVGGASITIQGNTGTPANVHLNMTSSCFVLNSALPCNMWIQGFKMTFAGASASAISMNAPGTIISATNQLAGGSTSFAGAYSAAIGGARIVVTTGQTITGGMSCFCQAITGGLIVFHGITVTLTGTPAFSWQTFSATSMGLINVSGVTFSGAATGTRYGTNTAGGINTGGGGASYLPGNAAGSATSPGWYI